MDRCSNTGTRVRGQVGFQPPCLGAVRVRAAGAELAVEEVPAPRPDVPRVILTGRAGAEVPVIARCPCGLANGVVIVITRNRPRAILRATPPWMIVGVIARSQTIGIHVIPEEKYQRVGFRHQEVRRFLVMIAGRTTRYVARRQHHGWLDCGTR